MYIIKCTNIFQSECNEYFNNYVNNKLSLLCKYSSAPVKTRDRDMQN